MGCLRWAWMVYMRYRLWLNSTELEGWYKLVGSELVLRTRAMYSLYTLTRKELTWKRSCWVKDRYTDFYRYVSVCAGIPLGHGKLLEFQGKISFLNFASACKQAYNFIRVSSLFLKKDDTAGILPVLQIIPFISLFDDVTSFKCCI